MRVWKGLWGRRGGGGWWSEEVYDIVLERRGVLRGESVCHT